MKPDNFQVVRDSVLRVGKVISVEDRTVRVEVDKLKNSSNLIFAGSVIKNTSVGGYVKIGKGFTWIIAKVEGEQIVEDKDYSKRRYKNPSDMLKRVLQLSLLGYLNDKGAFRRGIKELPLVFNECYLLTADEFEQIHQFVKGDDEPIDIGALTYEKNQIISVGVNALFASHFGIFGNTGSGKSYTLAKIYYELFNEYGGLTGFRERSQFLLIDFNGEYIDRPIADDGSIYGTAVITADSDLKKAYELSTGQTPIDKFPLPLSVVQDTQLWAIVLEATEKTQAPFLRRALESGFWLSSFEDEASFKGALGDLVYRSLKDNDSNLDKNFVSGLLREVRACFDRFNTAALTTLINDYDRYIKWHARDKYFYYTEGTTATATWNNNDEAWSRVTKDRVNDLGLPIEQLTDLERIRLLIVLKYYDESAQGFSNREHLSPLIKRLERRIHDLNKVFYVLKNDRTEEQIIIDRAKPLQIISLKHVNLTMRKIIPMVLCKMFYEDKKKSGNNSSYLNIIIDEAHNILSLDSTRESEQWRDYRLETFEEIIKEGRKFGTFLTIASQRPSDISGTIISQLHNYFLHRLINDRDIKAVERTVSYLDRLSFESMPILPTGTCILAGILAQIPVVVDIGQTPVENEPNNKTMTIVDKWRST